MQKEKRFIPPVSKLLWFGEKGFISFCWTKIVILTKNQDNRLETSWNSISEIVWTQTDLSQLTIDFPQFFGDPTKGKDRKIIIWLEGGNKSRINHVK
jgi:hypothetical protein